VASIATNAIRTISLEMVFSVFTISSLFIGASCAVKPVDVSA
jgi:hypothetical protein